MPKIVPKVTSVGPKSTTLEIDYCIFQKDQQKPGT